jgi:hypothetical protein
MTVTPSATLPGVQDVAIVLIDTVTLETTNVEYIGTIALDWDTPTKVGDILVGTFPDIDLPTTP